MNIRKHKLIGILVAALFAFFINPKLAPASGQPYDAQSMLAVMLSYSAPTNPLKKGLKEIKVVPAYILGDEPRDKPGGKNPNKNDTNEKVSGLGWAGSFVWGFSEHFGMSVLGAGVQESGTIDSHASVSYGVNDPNKYTNADQKGRGYVGALSLILDPFKGDGFRLPLLLGLSMNSFSSEVNKEGITWSKGSNVGPGVLAGIVPQFNAWKFRVAPYFLVSMMFSKATGTQTEFTWTGSSWVSGEKPLNNPGGDVVPAFGIDFTYRPWGLGFTYLPDIFGINAYTLKWSKKWGGEESKE